MGQSAIAGLDTKTVNGQVIASLAVAKARADFNEKIEKCQTPPLTHENIEATFAAMYAGRDDMFDRGVIACFKRLSWDYKTNNPVKFGKRIIVTYLADKLGTLSYTHVNELDDLQRVFRIVDGKPEEDHRNDLSTRIRQTHGKSRGGCVATAGVHIDEYMEVKWFKNGNGHITFTRPDLVDKLNSIIAKHYPGALPEPRS